MEAEDLLDKFAQDEGFGNWDTVVLNCHHSVIRSVAIAAVNQALHQPLVMEQFAPSSFHNQCNTLYHLRHGRFPCKKIRAGKYEYRGWIISCVGYYEPEQRVAWEAYDPKTGCADFHGFSKKEIKWLIDEYLSKNGG